MPPEPHNLEGESPVFRGRCFCGAVEIELSGVPVEMGYCHCASCRAWSGAPVTAFTLWPSDAVRIVDGVAHLDHVNKGGFSDRHWCTRCGGPLFVAHPGLGMIDVAAALLPDLQFVPSVHLNYAETVLPMTDGLPKLRDFPAAAGGSGMTVPEAAMGFDRDACAGRSQPATLTGGDDARLRASS